ncbi:MAG: hypothetical protein K2M17_05790 [Bacilli bacterium]|nr:hypothetical protein [Bacilli bacterium]
MKKVVASIIVVISCIFLVGCSCNNRTAKNAVEDFLDQYRNLSASVLADLENVIENENLSSEQEDKYREILKKEYSDLKYEILDETYDGESAVVKTKITVYNLYKAQSDAALYLNNNMDEFKDDEGNYDNKKYLDYKLDQMKKVTDTVEYTIEFRCTKNDNDNWEVNELTKEDLEKIHGIYNYDTTK